MKISPSGLNLIKKFEGFSATPYMCPGGKPTIGYGHVINKTESFTSLSLAQAEILLKTDVCTAEKAVIHMVKEPLTQHQFDALVSFVYNIGTKAFRDSTMLSLLRGNKPELAVNEFRKWIYTGGKIQKGLIKRRYEEAEMFKLPLPPPILLYS